MKYRRLGKTGLKVSEISLGSWLTYGGLIEKEQATVTIDAAYDLGINSFDTANVYATGEAEKIVGEALRKYPRESFVLSSKVFWPMGQGPNDRGLSKKHVFEQLHASLKRLDMDYLDIYYCHRYDSETPIDETLRTIDDMVRQGKVLYVGVSEWTAYQIQAALGTADKYLLDRIVVNQPVYNMFNRYIEKDVIPVSAENGIGQIVFSPLAQGILTGKYKTGEKAPEGSRASDPELSTHMIRYLTDENLEKVAQLQPIADNYGIKLSQLALAWVLRQDNVASAIVGATKPEQIQENAKAIDVRLPDEVFNQIEEIIGEQK